MEKEEITTNDYLKGIVLNLPDSPGIYQYLNSEGTIIYVGKAKNLKRRVSSYFNREHPYRDWETDRKSTRLNSSHRSLSRMPSSA